MVVVRYKVSNGVEFFENLTKATETNGVRGVHKLVLKKMTGKSKMERAVAKAAVAMERTKPSTRSDVQQKQAAAAASRDKEPSGTAAAQSNAEVVDVIRTSTPNKRKGDEMTASERDPKKATVEEDSDVEEIEVDEMTRDDKW
jgi:hypothetical protein